jgi:hypothetical protein
MGNYRPQRTYEYKWNREKADIFLKKGSPQFESIEDLVIYFLNKWKERISTLEKDSQYSTRIQTAIWVRFLHFFITHDSFERDDYLKLVQYRQNDELIKEADSIIARNCERITSLEDFWDICHDELNEWLDKVGLIMIKLNMPEYSCIDVLNLIYEIFRLQIFKRQFPHVHTCSECGISAIVFSKRTGTLICTSCGLVVDIQSI